jgi:membrane-bound metal-dependent hydrolase YbcI (DUF457 family)
MNWRAHLFIGLSLGAAAASLLGLGLPDALFFFAISGISSLLPDLDVRNSKASQATYFAAFLAVLALSYQSSLAKGGSIADFAYFFGIIAASLFAIDLLFRPRHRGVMHSMGFLFAVSAACFFAFGPLVAASFFIGYFSHLLADGRAIFNR